MAKSENKNGDSKAANGGGIIKTKLKGPRKLLAIKNNNPTTIPDNNRNPMLTERKGPKINGMPINTITSVANG